MRLQPMHENSIGGQTSYRKVGSMFSRRIAASFAILLLVVLILIGAYQRAARPSNGADARQRAQQRWLELVQDKTTAFTGADNARVLMNCFQAGDEARNYDKILDTGKKWEDRGETEYLWLFRIPKPPAVDSTHFLVVVKVSGDPPIIADVRGTYSAD